MGRKSIKESKTIYQEKREALNMTRADVADITDNVLSESRIEKIESESLRPRPEDIIQMSKVYNAPELCNYYCTNECEIGKKYVPEVKTVHDLPRITMELLSSINSLNRDKERLIDITADGQITEDETKDFATFKNHLHEMSLAIEALKLWADKDV